MPKGVGVRLPLGLFLTKKELMKLYRIKILYLGKDLESEVTAEFITANSDEKVYEWINTNHKWSEWPECVEMSREDILKEKGDFSSEYMGEFYDEKFGWEELAEVTECDIKRLKELKILTT